MKREIVLTDDGSTTIHLPEWNEQYHSKHGAIQEAYYVFIEKGLYRFNGCNTLSILEIGLGTGLNCFITLLEAKKLNIEIEYTGVEGYPVGEHELDQLNYTSELNAIDDAEAFSGIHTCPWEIKHRLNKTFTILKRRQFIEDISDENCFDLIYFDAFGARVQPELWTVPIFNKMFKALKRNGILVTYAAKGSVRRAMQEAGFTVERLPGPPGKREMLRALKN